MIEIGRQSGDIPEHWRSRAVSAQPHSRAPGIVETVRFFAVGTNMDEERLRNWIPSAERLGIASLSGLHVEMAQTKL